MADNKTEKLEAELKKYQEKLAMLAKDAAASRGGSRYGDEYLELQVKVYLDMVASIKKELVEARKKK